MSPKIGFIKTNFYSSSCLILFSNCVSPHSGADIVIAAIKRHITLTVSRWGRKLDLYTWLYCSLFSIVWNECIYLNVQIEICFVLFFFEIIIHQKGLLCMCIQYRIQAVWEPCFGHTRQSDTLHANCDGKCYYVNWREVTKKYCDCKKASFIMTKA